MQHKLPGNGLPAQQRGVILIVSLVLLVMISLLALNSMQTTTMELKMTTANQQQSVALSLAEKTLDEAEQKIDEIVTTAGRFDFAQQGDGFYIGGTVNSESLDWDQLSTQPGTEANSAYIAQYVGTKTLPGESTKVQSGGLIYGSEAHVFQLTAKADAGKGSRRHIQSIYITQDAP